MFRVCVGRVRAVLVIVIVAVGMSACGLSGGNPDASSDTGGHDANLLDADTTDCIQIDRAKVRSYSPAGVRVNFRVLDCNGYPVQKLESSNVVVINDEKKQPFGAGDEGGGYSAPDSPSEIALYSILALDMSDSIFGNGAVDDVVDGAKVFVRKLVSETPEGLRHRIAIMVFGMPSKTRVVQEYTDDADILNSVLEGLRDSTSLGTTDLYGTLLKAITSVSAEGLGIDVVERNIIILTDGTHEAGDEATMREKALSSKTVAEQNGTTVFSIGIKGEYDEETLEELASKPDYFVSVEDASELSAVFESISTRVKALANSNYVVGVCTPVVFGSPWLSIEITLGDAYCKYGFAYSVDGLTGDVAHCDPEVVARPCVGRECGVSPIGNIVCGTCPEGPSWWCNSGACVDDCADIECGNSPNLLVKCGNCPEGESWMCDAGVCKDDCAGLQCGSSPVLGLSCGVCETSSSWYCDGGVCTDDCDGLQCGQSPLLDVNCGACVDRNWCNAGICEDDCGSAECGNGPHGISCGSCPVGETIWCDAGVCKDDCDGLQCGQSPILDVNCGTCGDRNWCNAGICEDDCGSAECGPGAHGISCGSCPAGEYCDTGSCHDQVCEPLSVSCNGNVSETCNELGSAIASSVDCSDFSQVCREGGCCTLDCSGLECGDDGCGGSCGTCPNGSACTDGTCTYSWIQLLFEDFNDGVANGWTTPKGCPGYGCPSVTSGRYLFPGDWNAVKLPSVANSGAIADAFEFDLVRPATFGYLCIRDGYTGTVNDIFCIQHVVDVNGSVVDNVKGSQLSFVVADVLSSPGTNHWRIERDVVDGKCAIEVDGLALGSIDCVKSLPTDYVLNIVAATVTRCNCYVDDFSVDAMFGN